jgi:hypothetical protein
VLTSKRVIVSATFEQKEPGPPGIVPHLRPYLKSDDRLEVRGVPQWVTVKVNTLEPGRVLKGLIELETLLGLKLWVEVQPDNPLAEALHRIRQDLKADSPRR